MDGQMSELLEIIVPVLRPDWPGGGLKICRS